MRRALVFVGMIGIAFVGTTAVSLHAAEPPAAAPAQSQAAINYALSRGDFHATLREFDEWASVQKIYDAQQIKTFRAKLIDKASQLSGAAYDDFLADLNGRLKVLMSAEAREARKWLGENLAVASDAYAKQLKSQYPDVAKMTADQIQERLAGYDDQRSETKKLAAAEKSQRKFEVDQILTDKRRQEDANLAVELSSMNSSSGSGGYYPGGAYRGTRNYSTPYRNGGYYGYGLGGFRW